MRLLERCATPAWVGERLQHRDRTLVGAGDLRVLQRRHSGCIENARVVLP
jgi:hypothetical protein